MTLALPTPTQPLSTRATFLIVLTFVDGSVHYEQCDTKEEANDILASSIADAEIADWIAYQMVKAK